MIIAIDGPAGSGKRVLAQKLAKHFNLAHLDTGLLYRAVALKIISKNQDLKNELIAQSVAKTLDLKDLNSSDLRSEAVSNAASVMAVYPLVRKELLQFQRNFSSNVPNGFKGVVLDGRDIGTVVLPKADFKIFIAAGIDVRAKRRFKELQERGFNCIYEEIIEDMRERDKRDMQRLLAPLEPASDAFIIDSTNLNREEVFKKAYAFIRKKKL